jgi:hypothetical protein
MSDQISVNPQNQTVIKKNIVIVSSHSDASKEVFVSHDSECNIRIFTPLDLSTTGWHYRNSDMTEGVCVIGSEAMSYGEIDGVIVRLPAVSHSDLPHIIEVDRTYLAAEMTAFLLAWLSSLKCPMLNRPTSSCLSGPYLRQEQLTYFVAQLGVPVVSCRKVVGYGLKRRQEEIKERSTVIIVGKRHVGNVHPILVHYAQRIAKALNVEFFAVSFSRPDKEGRFIGIDLWPDISDELAGLMIEHLLGTFSGRRVESDLLCV